MELVQTIKDEIFECDWGIWKLNDKFAKKYNGRKFVVCELHDSDMIFDDEDILRILKRLNSEKYEGVLNSQREAVIHIKMIADKLRLEKNLQTNIEI